MKSATTDESAPSSNSAIGETCVLCGGEARLVVERQHMQSGKKGATIEVERFRCDDCDELFATPAQMRLAQQRLAGVLREQEGKWTPEQIRQFRHRRRLTQPQLERILGTGPKTVVRWERGTVVQGATADRLLRMMDTVPGALEFLAHESGVPLHSSANEEPEQLGSTLYRVLKGVLDADLADLPTVPRLSWKVDQSPVALQTTASLEAKPRRRDHLKIVSPRQKEKSA